MLPFSSPFASPCLPLWFTVLLGPSSRSQTPPWVIGVFSMKPRGRPAIRNPVCLSRTAPHSQPLSLPSPCCSEDGMGDWDKEDALPVALLVAPAPASRVHHPGTPRGRCGPRQRNSPSASYRNRNTPTDGQTDRWGFSPSRRGGALCHAPAAAPCSPQIPSSSSPSLSAKSSPCFLAPDPGDQTRGDTTAQNREQNRERIQKQHDCSVAQQASSGPGPRTGRRDGKN